MWSYFLFLPQQIKIDFENSHEQLETYVNATDKLFEMSDVMVGQSLRKTENDVKTR